MITSSSSPRLVVKHRYQLGLINRNRGFIPGLLLFGNGGVLTLSSRGRLQLRQEPFLLVFTEYAYPRLRLARPPDVVEDLETAAMSEVLASPAFQ